MQSKDIFNLVQIVIYPFILCLIFNFYTLQNAIAAFGYQDTGRCILIMFILIAPLLIASAQKKFLYMTLIAVLFITNSTVFFLYHFYAIDLSFEMIESLMITNPHEIIRQADSRLLIIILILLSLYLYWSYHLISKITLNIKISAISVIMLICVNLLFLNSLCNKIKMGYFFSKISPLNTVYFLHEYITDLMQNQNTNKTNPFSAEKLQQNIKGLKIVLVLGESARRDRFSINGYNRMTNPFLSKIPHIISYSNANSNATYTIQSVKNLMKQNSEAKHYSYIELLNMLGFETIVLSNQGKANSPINQIFSEAKEVVHLNRIEGFYYDEELLPHFKSSLKKDLNQFFIIHTFGSHHQYDSRYPDQFKIFTPTCKDSMTLQSFCTDAKPLSNSYDNSILYTDYVLAEMITLLAEYNALFIYVSDHGESLGEQGTYLHSTDIHNAPQEQTQIPLVFWPTETFIQKYPKKFTALQRNRHNNVTHKNILPTILDCIGLKQNYSKELSVCSIKHKSD